jgi:hypothetical protein
MNTVRRPSSSKQDKPLDCERALHFSLNWSTMYLYLSGIKGHTLVL